MKQILFFAVVSAIVAGLWGALLLAISAPGWLTVGVVALAFILSFLTLTLCAAPKGTIHD